MKTPNRRGGVAVCASLMCANFARLADDVRAFERGGVDCIHFDIMDGSFVPNFTLGPDIMRAVAAITDLRCDAHLMTVHPERHIDTFRTAGADIITVHAETDHHLPRTLEQIRASGASPAVALNPATPTMNLDCILELVDMVLLMTVNPGFAGQRLVPGAIEKIADMRERIESCGRDVDIQVDGNVSFENIPAMVRAGASALVCGSSSIYRAGRPLAENLRELNELIETL